MSYAHTKLGSWTDDLAEYKETGRARLITCHLMPQNTCNQSCSFCAYRLTGNKNSAAFDTGQHLDLPVMERLLDDLEDEEVEGVEVTGGGEPLAYPHTEALWEGLAKIGASTALVTNGTLMCDYAPLICSSGLKWARVSIDAATPETYSAMRKCPESHFEKAWDAVARLREYAPQDAEFKLGVGFVLCRENLGEVREFVRRAQDSGADNVRLSKAFGVDLASTPEEWSRLDTECNVAGTYQGTPGIKVHDLLSPRAFPHPTQDYDTCHIQNFLCVVEGAGDVYRCCTMTGSGKWKLGNINEHPGGFAGVWRDSEEQRQRFSARDNCKFPCIYRPHNLAIEEMLVDMPHKEFL